LRRFGALLLAFCFLAVTATVGRAAESDEPVIPADAYLVMDATTGEVLLAHEAHTQLPMASTTKIMTALVALERGNLQDVVTVGQKPYDTGGTTIWLDMGEQQTLENLLKALMLESANDAAVAIAEHLGAGHEETFVQMMNDRAREMGLQQTHFANSHGLHDPDHYTTAYDLAVMARVAMQNPAFRQLVSLEEATIPGYKQNPPRELHSHNQLLGYYEGANGVKNGFTEEAGLTNVASARRGDTELIAVVLGAQNRLWTSSMALLDWGFSHHQTRPVVQTKEAAPANAAAKPPAPAPAPEVEPAGAGPSVLRWPWWIAGAAGTAAAGGWAALRFVRRTR
jgi:D-alanyl-D-alanine carboxypeptidase (penicillin-binding protein 5/6)